jgi:hypothetical protein
MTGFPNPTTLAEKVASSPDTVVVGDTMVIEAI